MARRKGVRLEQIANEVGASIVTVSNALNDRKGVSDELRKKIKETAAAMGYQINKENHAKKKAAYVIGVIVAERYVKEFPSFYMDIYKRIAQESTKRGCMTILEVVDCAKESLEYNFSAFQGSGVSGIIIIGEMNRAYVSAVKKMYEGPIVCVDFYDVEEDIDYIVTDSYGGMEQMTELLLQNGMKKLMFVGTPKATGSIMDRYQGFVKAMTKYGIEVCSEQILYDRDEDVYKYKMDVELPEILPDGFVCNCDKTARMLIEKLMERGVQIPEEVSVVSFDHYYSEAQQGIELTTYENDEKIMANISVNTLIKRIEGGRQPAGVRIVEGKIVHGNTVKFQKEGGGA